MNLPADVEISVVVPCRNGERFLADCLESLLQQSLPGRRYEVILVDNNSTDDTLNIARSYPDVKVIQEPRRGAYAARNAGVRMARGRVLAFTDADCVVGPCWLEAISEALSEESIHLTIGPRHFSEDQGLLSTMSDYENAKVRYVFALHEPRFYYGYTNNLAVSRIAFERCGPFVELLRGADTVFVSHLVREFGPAAARFNPAMVIRHLEIETWKHWPTKMWIYGQSYQSYCSLSSTIPLTFQHRLQILRLAIASGSGPWRLYAFLLMGSLNALAYRMGRLRAVWRSSGSSA